MLAGMRAAFDAMFRQFDPAALQERFERKGKSAGILGNTKAHYWEQFVELYGDLKEDEERSYHRLFGDEFARAYEQQMQRMAGSRRR
jgi:predicted component of type VI protein secretion system